MSSRGRLQSRCTSRLGCWHMPMHWCGRRYWRWRRSIRRYRPRCRRTRRGRFDGLRRQQLRLLWLRLYTEPRTTLHRIRARRHRALRALSGRLCHALSTKKGRGPTSCVAPIMGTSAIMYNGGAHPRQRGRTSSVLSMWGSSLVDVFVVTHELVFLFIVQSKVLECHLVSQNTTDTTEALAELHALL